MNRAFHFPRERSDFLDLWGWTISYIRSFCYGSVLMSSQKNDWIWYRVWSTSMHQQGVHLGYLTCKVRFIPFFKRYSDGRGESLSLAYSAFYESERICHIVGTQRHTLLVISNTNLALSSKYLVSDWDEWIWTGCSHIFFGQQELNTNKQIICGFDNPYACFLLSLKSPRKMFANVWIKRIIYSTSRRSL